MTTAVATRNGNGHPPTAVTIEDVLIRGDLAALTPEQRKDYYFTVCKSVGLNPLTQPFAYITLNGKLTLYALRNCTDQLRSIHKISVVEMTEAERDGVCIVTCKVANAAGRTDISKGAVNIASLKGEALANAIMKAETKAKRRATLSICGLSLLDETEIEDIPASAKRQNPHANRTEDIVDIPPEGAPGGLPGGDPSIKILPKGATRAEMERAQKEMYAIDNEPALDAWGLANKDRFAIFHPDYKATLDGLFRAHRQSIRAKVKATAKDDGLDIPPELDRREPPADPEKFLKWADGILAAVIDPGMLDRTWDFRIEPHLGQLLPPDQEEVMGIYRKHEARLS